MAEESPHYHIRIRRRGRVLIPKAKFADEETAEEARSAQLAFDADVTVESCTAACEDSPWR